MLALLALLPLHIHNYIAFLFIVLSLVSAFAVPGLRREKCWSWIGWMFIPVFIGVLSWMFSGTNEKTLNFIGMYGVIAVWPLALGITSRFRRAEWVEVFFRIFVWSTVVAVLFYNAQLAYRYFAQYEQFQLLRQQHDFSFIYRTTFSKISGIHPTYFSLWIWTAVGTIFFRYKKQWKRYLVPTLLLIVGSVLLNSRMPFIAFSLSITPFVITSLKPRHRLIFFGGLAVVVALFGMSRFGEIKNAFNTNQLNSVNIRWQIWNCAVEGIEHGGVQGLGTGSGNEWLYDCYRKNGYQTAAEQHLNSHNMYLHFFLENGWWGGIAFMVFIAGLMRRFVRDNRSNYAIWFVIFFSLCMLTENLFHRQPAVATFGLFISLFAFTNRKLEA
jgi:hypothetical protein